MNPPISGPIDGPMKGAAVYIIIGNWRVSRLNMSPTVPPATERNALPDKPSKNLAISIVSMFFATADGISQIRNRLKDTK